MKSTKLARGVASAALFAGVLGWGALAHAVPVSGIFTLTGDALGSFPNTTVASGTFTTGDATTIVVDGYTDASGNTFDTIGLSAFTVTDLTGAISVSDGNPNSPLGVFADFTLADFSGIGTPVGVLSGNSPESVLAFVGFGSAINPGTGQTVFLTLNGPNHPSAPGQAAQFSTTNLSIGVDVSGVQVVPEPGALALLGAGVFAFGVSRRRRRARLSS